MIKTHKMNLSCLVGEHFVCICLCANNKMKDWNIVCSIATILNIIDDGSGADKIVG